MWHILNSVILDEEIIVTGGSEALKFLESQNKNTKISFKTYPKAEFQKLMTSCKKLVTTSGLTTTIEAFYSKTPVHFLLPSNLSQYKIYHLLGSRKLTNRSLEWDTYFTDMKGSVWDTNEKEALKYLDSIARSVLMDQEILDDLVRRFQEILSSTGEIKSQENFIRQNGISGAQDIFNTLDKAWFKNE